MTTMARALTLLPLDPSLVRHFWQRVLAGLPTPALAYGPEVAQPRPRPQDMYFAVESPDRCGDIIGLAWTQALAPETSPTTRTFGLGLFAEARGQGYGPKLKDALLAHCFSDPLVWKVETEVYSSNEHSLKALHERHGVMAVEGCQRATICIDGTYYDRLLFGLTRTEWEALL